MMFVMVACGDQSDESQEDNDEATSSEENGQDNEEEASDSDEAQNDGEVEAESNDEQNSNESADADNQATSDSSDNNELPATIEINEQVQHEDGITLTLEQIAFEEDHITVDFNAENLSGFSKTLASAGRAKGSNLGGVTLQDDTGYDYRYVADDDSDRIELEDQEKVTGTISFAGRIQDDAQSLTLIFNPNNVEPQFDFEDIQIEW